MKLRTKRWLDAGCVLAVVLVFAIAGALTWVARGRELDASRAEVANLTAALELYVRSTVTSIDQSLIGARHALRLLGPENRASFEAGSKVLADILGQLGLPVSMYVLGLDGRAVFSADGLHTDVSAADRPYFRIHETRADAGLYVSELLTSRVSGLESLVFSRRLEDAQGQFAGVIVVTAPVSVFERDFARLGVGRAGVVALGDDTGRLYARRPARADMVGKKVLRADSEALALLGRGVDSGLVSARSPLDGVQRLAGFRRVAATRLVVMVSNSYDEQLASWRLQATVVAVTALLLGSGSLLLFTLFTRDLVRKTQLTEELRHAVNALQQSVRAEQDASAAKTAFLSSMSHELMTPLNGIYGAVQLWQLGEKDADRKRLADVAKTSTERLNGALRDALAYANATSSAVQSALLPLDLRVLLAELPEMFAAQPGSRECRLSVAAPDDAPCPVQTDPAAIRDALRRMLNVAVRVARRVAAAPQSTDDGGVPLAEAAAGGSGVAAPLPRLAQPGWVNVRVEPVLPGGGFRVTVDTATEAGAGDRIEAVLQPFADPGATESSGLHDAGLSLEVARLLAVRAGAALHVACHAARLSMALALPPA